MWEEIELPGGCLRFWPGFLPAAEATRLQQTLATSLDWQRDRVRLFGREHLIPRRHQWYGDSDASYSWSGLQMQPLPWTAELRDVRDRVAAVTATSYNSVLANLYRDGRDSMGWHADDESELGRDPVIASLSLGAERDLLFRRSDRGSRDARSRKLALTHGSLLLMTGSTQHNWQHALPKRTRVSEPRINLTFRLIRAS